MAPTADVMPPRERDRHALTTANAAQVFQKNGSQWVAEGAFPQTLFQHGHRGGRGLSTATSAPSSTTGHAHSTPSAERMACEMSSTFPTPLIR